VYKSFQQQEDTIDILHHNADFNPNSFILHPNAAARRCWDMVTAVLVVYVAWDVPRSLAFGDWGVASSKPMGVFMDIWFLCDIALNFRTGNLGSVAGVWPGMGGRRKCVIS
jgi:hypothetical protein